MYTLIASSYLVFFPSKRHQPTGCVVWLSCYLASAKEDRRSAILSTADTALGAPVLSKQATWQTPTIPRYPEIINPPVVFNFYHFFGGRYVIFVALALPCQKKMGIDVASEQ